MAETLRARGLGELPIYVINNPPLNADAERAQPPANLRKPRGTRRVIFAGNLGRFQNLPLLAEGVARCFSEHPELELMFLGDGVALPELKREWGEHPQVRFAPFMPFAQAREIIADADIGLVSLSPNIYRVAFPSKVATYLDLGLKILALVEPKSEMAKELVATRAGAVPSARTAEAIASALKVLLEMEDLPRSAGVGDQEEVDWSSLINMLESNS
jgi:glycosyltransferase involved in cell wall biosynthesis